VHTKVKGLAMRWLRRAALGLAGMAALLAAGAAVYIQRALPQAEGRLQLAGLHAELRIERDEHGIPTIHAASPEDALFGLGFVHAQDRLWQLETHRRIGAGRIAEAFGATAVDADRFLRALGVRRAAAAQWAQASAPVRAAVLAYTAGINACLRDGLKARPPEFIVLGLQPEPWTPEDTLAWAIMMAWDLGGNWGSELARLRLALTLPVQRINQLLPPYRGEPPLVTSDYTALFRGLKLDAKLATQALADDAPSPLFAPESGVQGVGSNNWVIAGSHTESGAPLLANDPHLKLTSPALWYIARLDAPGLRVAGATMPGLPLVVLGQNEHLAWGYTNTAPDVQDLYIERIKPDDATKYQTPDGWAEFDMHDETIKVRGGADVPLKLRSTRHGPVLSDSGAIEGLTGPAAQPSYAISMRWTALDPDPRGLDAALAFNRASSVDEFIRAAADYVAPMQNMVVADRAGHIGMVAAGRVPLRKPDNELKGQLPSPGWDTRYDWAGFLDPRLTPRETDPPRGWIATANQRIHPSDYPHYIGSEWAPPYRMERIEQMLAARPKHSVASLREMQADVLSMATLRLLPFLLKAHSAHPLAPAAMQTLAGFDGRMAADAAAPLIFWAWVRQLTPAVFADEIGTANWQRVFGGRTFREALDGVLERDDAWWCDDKATAAAESCAMQIDAAFTRALDELQAGHGANVATWRWGDAHIARAEHRPFSNVRGLARLFELRTPVGGDTFTVNVSRVNLVPDKRTGELYLAEHAASLRAIYDLGDPARSRIMLSSGQSGLPFAAAYRNFVEPWAKVDDLPLWGGASVHTLVLAPASAP
jgi:penicillin amidase